MLGAQSPVHFITSESPRLVKKSEKQALIPGAYLVEAQKPQCVQRLVVSPPVRALRGSPVRNGSARARGRSHTHVGMTASRAAWGSASALLPLTQCMPAPRASRARRQSKRCPTLSSRTRSPPCPRPTRRSTSTDARPTGPPRQSEHADACTSACKPSESPSHPCRACALQGHGQEVPAVGGGEEEAPRDATRARER